MDTETIDLTDPLEDILKQGNWTPESLNERFSFLSEKGRNVEKNVDRNVTLNDLLGDCVDQNPAYKSLFNSSQIVKSSSNEEDYMSHKVEDVTLDDSETIELSDDEVFQMPDSKDETSWGNADNVTEVQVIEVSDISDQNSNSDQNEDDDDFFVEASVNKSSSLGLNSASLNSSTSQRDSQDIVHLSPLIIDKSFSLSGVSPNIDKSTAYEDMIASTGSSSQDNVSTPIIDKSFSLSGVSPNIDKSTAYEEMIASTGSSSQGNVSLPIIDKSFSLSGISPNIDKSTAYEEMIASTGSSSQDNVSPPIIDKSFSLSGVSPNVDKSTAYEEMIASTGSSSQDNVSPPIIDKSFSLSGDCPNVGSRSIYEEKTGAHIFNSASVTSPSNDLSNNLEGGFGELSDEEKSMSFRDQKYMDSSSSVASTVADKDITGVCQDIMPSITDVSVPKSGEIYSNVSNSCGIAYLTSVTTKNYANIQLTKGSSISCLTEKDYVKTQTDVNIEKRPELQRTNAAVTPSNESNVLGEIVMTDIGPSNPVNKTDIEKANKLKSVLEVNETDFDSSLRLKWQQSIMNRDLASTQIKRLNPDKRIQDSCKLSWNTSKIKKQYSSFNINAKRDTDLLDCSSLNASSRTKSNKDTYTKYLDYTKNCSDLPRPTVTDHEQTRSAMVLSDCHDKTGVSMDIVPNDLNVLEKGPCITESMNTSSTPRDLDLIKSDSQPQLTHEVDNTENILHRPSFDLKGFPEETTEDDASKLEKSFESSEEIRKNLKLQLTNLRTRKKVNILQTVKQTVDDIDKLQSQHSFSKRSNHLNLLANETNREVNLLSKTPRTEVKDASEVSPLINKQTTDLTDISVDLQKEENVPNILNEIRRIIGRSKPLSNPLEHNMSLNVGKVNTNAETSGPKDTYGEEVFNKERIGSGTLQDGDLHLIANNKGQLESDNTVSSPFVSNTLDEFLIDSKLNVSYAIPKSGAEEGLRLNYSEVPIVSFESKVKNEENEKSKEEAKYKPKTLAEKRRILEKDEKRKQKRLAKLRTQGERMKRSYVLFKDKKVFIQSKSVGKCIASIESSISVLDESTPVTTFKKPSLLTELYRKGAVKYRPGPLSKKYLLQSDYSQWATELKTLPRVVLSIIPELGKPVHPNLSPMFSQWNGELSENQIDFALTALLPKSHHSKQIFKFELQYENRQDKFLVRKKNLGEPMLKFNHLNDCNTHSPPEKDDVAEVIDNLIKYVEIKEIASTLIKNDDDFISNSETPEMTEDSTNKKHDSNKKQFRKLSRTNKELLRLNCKVVSMEVKESEQKISCSKPYCKLGCVCKSLQCDTIIGLHCRKNTCMFGCSCPKESNKIISISRREKSVNFDTDLSTDTVTRIEGEAKRNLAKEEREFTQTVIYANDKTIVVGVGNKQRRAAKTPKKYTDFFDEDLFNEKSSDHKRNKKLLVNPCDVLLEKWDFSDIIPYCLAHNLYNCHCKGYSDLSARSARGNPIIEDKKYISKKINVMPNSEKLNDNDSNELTYSLSKRPIRKRKFAHKSDFVRYDDNMHLTLEKIDLSEDPIQPKNNSVIFEIVNCSRTSEIPKKYRTIKKFTSSATSWDFCNSITDADLFKMKLNGNEDLLESEQFKISIIKQQKKLLETSPLDRRKTHKRKQKIQVRQDEDLNINATNLVIPKVVSSKEFIPISALVPSKKVKRKVNPVFGGEIIVSDTEWLKKLCGNTKQPLDSYARILPWNALIKGFLSRSINVYCICDMPLRLLLNVGEKLVGNKIVDIEESGHTILETPLKGKAPWLVSQSENVRDIIKWLLSGTLSSKYKPNTLSFLLVETLPGQFEVRGLCTQNEKPSDKPDPGKTEPVVKDDKNMSDEITEIKHKNMNSEIESLFITKGKFRLRELVEDGFDDDLVDNLYMWVGLPEVYKVAKWRVIFLKNDFVYLYFKNIKYSIKYTDLVKLTEMAKEDQLTLLVRNLQINRSYDHALFGLYVSPTYTDRIFIGPYFINYEGDDVETLKYVNESLVRSESFNRMKGILDDKCGYWMYERPYYHTPKNYPKETNTPKNYPKETIDLTKEDSVKTTVLNRNQTEKKSNPPPIQPPIDSPNDEQIITHNGLPVLIKNSKPRSPSEFNRFIITNIPHFGYLGAFQPDHSSTLEVSWPFEKKVLQFENADHARDFLQERFNQLLQPVPDTFKIQVIVLIHLDLNEHKPINSDFLSGHCICGYFGTYNFKQVSDDFCRQELKMSKEQITKLFAKRAHDYIRKKIAQLAEAVGIEESDTVNYNVANIIQKAKDSVKVEEHLRIHHIAEIHVRENAVVENIKKLFNRIKTLPKKERNIESKILNEILQIRPKRFGVNKEIIEIKDDDSSAANQDGEMKKIEIANPISTEVYFKRKHENEAINRRPKIAKVAPFTSTVVSSNTEINDIVVKPTPLEPEPDETVAASNAD